MRRRAAAAAAATGRVGVRTPGVFTALVLVVVRYGRPAFFFFFSKTKTFVHSLYSEIFFTTLS